MKEDIDSSNIPRHIAVIMDGNRRWARKRGLPAAFGHKKGVDTVKKIVEAASNMGVKALTLFAFSTENWKRSGKEVNALMSLLRQTIRKYSTELYENNIKLMVSGRVKEMPPPLNNEIAEAIERLKGGKKMVLNIALNYGGRQEILDAVNRILKARPGKITEKEFEKYLYTYPLPNPDLLIRTSGEMRISNFLLWQSAYSEIYITDVLWPDFTENHLRGAILEYQKRQRRFGT